MAKANPNRKEMVLNLRTSYGAYQGQGCGRNYYAVDVYFRDEQGNSYVWETIEFKELYLPGKFRVRATILGKRDTYEGAPTYITRVTFLEEIKEVVQ